jgi:hypothetical protein
MNAIAVSAQEDGCLTVVSQAITVGFHHQFSLVGEGYEYFLSGSLRDRAFQVGSHIDGSVRTIHLDNHVSKRVSNQAWESSHASHIPGLCLPLSKIV